MNSKYILHLNDKETEKLSSEKIIGYRILDKIKHDTKISPLPEPFIVLHPEIFKNKESLEDCIKELKDTINKEFINKKLLTMRVASKPLIDHSPNFKIDIQKQDYFKNMESGIRKIIEFSKNRNYSEMCVYIHPWAEPEKLKASVDVYTSLKDNTVRLYAGYGCGYGLEFGGDEFIVDVNNKKLKSKKITKKQVYFKVWDSKTLNDPPKRFNVPIRLQETQVLKDEEAIEIALKYSNIEKLANSPVRLHWTRVKDNEEYTIDFQFIKNGFEPEIKQLESFKVIEMSSLNDRHKIKDNNYLYVIKPSSETENAEDLYTLIQLIPKGAYITSTGGYTSHPAVVSREGGKTYISLPQDQLPKEGDTVSVSKENHSIKLNKLSG